MSPTTIVPVMRLTVTVMEPISPTVQIPDHCPMEGIPLKGLVTTQTMTSDNVGVTHVRCRIDDGPWQDDATIPSEWSYAAPLYVETTTENPLAALEKEITDTTLEQLAFRALREIIEEIESSAMSSPRNTARKRS